jgi:hypothetical protein
MFAWPLLGSKVYQKFTKNMKALLPHNRQILAEMKSF